MSSSERASLSISKLIEQRVLAIGDGYRAKNSELSSEGYPFARVANINGGFQFENADYFPIEDLHKVGEKVSRPNDVVFTSKGTVGRFAFVTEDVPTFVYSPQLCYWRVLNENVLTPRFLFYWMQSKEFRVQANSVKGQTDMADYVSLVDQRRMKITLPPLATQRRIADILSALDDKIELNRQTNDTLEAMAQAIFKEWFVNFNYPGATGEMVESELGLIPKGWRIGTLGEILSFKNGKSSPERDDNFEYPVYGANGIIGFAATSNSNEKTIIIGRVGSFCGAVYFTLQKSYVTENAIIADPIQKDSSVFCFNLLQTLDLNNYKVGSGQPLINQSIVSGIVVIIPDSLVLEKYEELALPQFVKIFENDRQSQNLSQIRDILLPKLMSGEIEV